MAMAIELSESQMPRPLPQPSFSTPFAAPSLRWACKKRLRCFHPAAAAAAAALRLSTSFDALPPPNLQCDGAAASPSRSPPPSDRPGNPIPVPAPSRKEGAREEEPQDPPSTARAGRLPWGWCLRSRRVRGSDEDVEEAKKKRKVATRKVELWVALSRDEIEGDFLRMTGAKPPAGPGEGGGRAASNHHLKGIFPGSCLPTSFAADRYKVPEPSDSRKR